MPGPILTRRSAVKLGPRMRRKRKSSYERKRASGPTSSRTACATGALGLLERSTILGPPASATYDFGASAMDAIGSSTLILHRSITLLTAAFLGFLFYIAVTRMWRNEWNTWDPDRVASWWPYGGALWRAVLRFSPAGGAAGVLTGLSAFLLSFESDGLYGGGLVLAILALGVFFVVCASIALFNRPKRLVAPHLRDQPGAIGEWLGRPVPPTPPPRHRPLLKRSRPRAE
jgi:hypothetical protein